MQIGGGKDLQMIPHFNEVTDIPQNELKQTNKIISFNIPGWLGFFSHLDTICLYTCSMMLPTSIIKSQNRSVANARSGKKMHFYMQGVTETHFLISTCKQSPELCTQIANKELKHNHVGCTQPRMAPSAYMEEFL